MDTGYFYDWVIVHNPAGNMGLQILLWNSDWLHQFTFPLTVLEGPLFSISSPIFAIFHVSHNSHPNRREMISCCDFNLQFPYGFAVKRLLMKCWPFMYPLWKKRLFLSFVHFVIRSFVVFFYYIIGILTPYQIYGLWIFFPLHRLTFHFVDYFSCCAETF